MGRMMQTIVMDDLPPIVVAEEQFDALSDIAEGLTGVLPHVAGFLDRELNRARLLPLAHVPSDVVKVNSIVEFTLDTRGERVERLKLSYPAESTAGDGYVSIASPVGVALLGLREGQSIEWTSRYGERRSLKVLKVTG